MSLSKDDVAFLEAMDTPTTCNVIEIAAPERRDHGYTTRYLHCLCPALRPGGAALPFSLPRPNP